MSNRTMLDVLESEEGKDSVKYVLDKAYTELADAAGVSVKTFRIAINLIIEEGYSGFYPEEATISFSEAKRILEDAHSRSSLEDYEFFSNLFEWSGEDSEGNILPNAVVTAKEQLEYIFSEYRKIYGSLP